MIDLNANYFTEQIITYIGNKRSLLAEINHDILYVKKVLGKKKLITADLFSGSGIVARLLKSYSKLIIANDLEEYSRVINECFLSNKDDFDINEFHKYLNLINEKIDSDKDFMGGIITNLYSPKEDDNIKPNERVFYTHENALYIDKFRHYIDVLVPSNLKKYFLALLITEASIHVNTSGVFKGFYKDKNTGIGKFGGTAQNALSRIKGKIVINPPILSDVKTDYKIYQEDTISLSKKLDYMDLVYLDPPYNQHPYGSNYFMLNLIIDNKMPRNISKVSGIPKNWHHSPFNKRNTALSSLESIVSSLNASFVLISYNNEGFITFEQMHDMLKKYGDVTYRNIVYNTFRGSRNLHSRDIHTKEFLFLLRKEKK